MQLYAYMRNPIIADDRVQLVKKFKKLSPEYAELYDVSKKIDDYYSEKLEKAEADDDLDAADDVINAWEKAAIENDKKCKQALTKFLNDNNYDGVILKKVMEVLEEKQLHILYLITPRLNLLQIISVFLMVKIQTLKIPTATLHL